MNGARALLIALLAGLALGFAIRMSGEPTLLAHAHAAKPIGTLWLNALKMTLVPLIFAMVAGGVGAFVTGGSGGRTIGFALGLFAALLVIATALGMGLMTALLSLWPTPQGALAGLLSAPAAAPPEMPTLVDQILALVPVNPVAAASQGAMAPLVVFALCFGVAAARITPHRRDALAAVITGIGETMMMIVHGILWFAPLGVFVLALGVALDAGVAVAALLVQAIVLKCAVSTICILFCYGIARFGGGIALRRFAAAAAGPQAMAAGTCSSMATLPAMIEAAETKLGHAPAFAGAILPLAVSTFRFGTGSFVGASTVFVASAAGIHPTIGQYIAVVGVIALTNIGIAGLPAAAVIYAALAPGFQVLGAPLEMIPLLIAISAIPDVFDTTCNVTADLAVATVIARFTGRSIADPGEGALVPVAEAA
jgi:Na+/H+-dicarboxylate symporter